MITAIKSNIRRKLIIYLMCFGFLWAAFISQFSFLLLIRFIWIQLTAVLMPGILALYYIGYNEEDNNKWIFLGYAMGIVIDIYIYIFFAFLGHQKFIGIFANVLSIICILNLIFLKRNKTKSFLKGEGSNRSLTYIVFIILLIGMCIRFWLYQIPNLSAMITGFFNPELDSLWWLRNSVAVSNGYPVEQVGLSGYHFYYHLFSNDFQAFLHYASGVDYFDLTYVFAYVWEIFSVC